MDVSITRPRPARSIKHLSLRIMALIMFIGMLNAIALPEPVWQLPELDLGGVVQGENGEVSPRPDNPAVQSSYVPEQVEWPPAATRTVTAGEWGRTAETVHVGEVPVRVSKNSLHSPDAVEVEVHDTRTTFSEVRGLVIEMTPLDDGRGEVDVEIDYSGFSDIYGGDFGGRLTLTQLHDCDIASLRQCRWVQPALVSNHSDDRVLAATLSADGLFLVAADDASAQGDYKATALSPSSQWSVSGSNGGFTWDYAIDVPPTPGELSPAVSLGYNSQTVDGRTSATNNQGSWIGEGFSYEPGYIERRYKPCADDGHDGKGDLCWAWDNATIMLNGASGELVKDGDTWRISSDDGSRVERFTGAVNGDDNGERWVVTSSNGTQYHFGLHRLPGWSSGDETTDSVWTVPVFGDDADEPCHASTFAESYCDQAWRWNLDHVVDTKGNAVSYFYGKETNHYSRNADTSVNGDAYVRGGYLKRIDFGQRADAIYTQQASAQVVFTTTERCLPTADFACNAEDLTDANASFWPDVPFDLLCDAGTECINQMSPTFFTRMRLETITTQIWTGTAYDKVDSWSLGHIFTDNADGSKTLWLNTITHTGHAGDGPDITLPAVELQGIQLANRVDTIDDNISPLVRFRLGRILTEHGGQIDITYSEQDCAPGDTPQPATNIRRCQPVIWSPLGEEDPITDWFHKYVVDQIVITDRTGGNPDQLIRYDYEGSPAWRHARPDGITEDEYLTWSDWRGYQTVTTITGDPNSITPQRTTHTYFRGMHGDETASGGSKNVTITDSEGTVHTDHDELAGTTLETTVFNGDEVVSKTIDTSWRHRTAQDSHDWGDQEAYFVHPGTSHTYTALAAGGWRETKTANTYEETYGLIVAAEDLGDLATTTDDRCTTTEYATNVDAHIVAAPSAIETVALACGVTPTDPATQTIASSRLAYDGTPVGTPPTVGLLTGTDVLDTFNGDAPQYVTSSQNEYDEYGRTITVTGADGQTTSIEYTDAHGRNTQQTTVNALGHTGTVDFDPWRQQQTTATDPNGRSTRFAYDALGRISAIAVPGMDLNSPTMRFDYRIVADEIVAVSTESIASPASGITYQTSVELFDGQLRSRQTQLETPDGRLVTDTLYDSAGRVQQVNDVYFNDQAVSTELFQVADGNVDGQAFTEYDGAGRQTASVFAIAGQEQWRTSMEHGGDRVHVTPAEGGTATTTITDARGNTTALRQYHGPTPTGSYDETTYTYTPADQIATVSDAVGNTWTYEYDLRGNKVAATDPDSGHSTFTYDDMGRMATSTDARGETIAYQYDALGRKTGEFEGTPTGPRLAVWQYDQVDIGQLYSAGRYYDGQVYGYSIPMRDDLYRPITTNYHVPSSEGALAGTYSFHTGYNIDGSIQSTSYPTGGGMQQEVVVYNYDLLGNITSVAGDSIYASQLAYAYTGELLRGQYGSGAERFYRYFEYEDGTDRLARSRIDRYDATSVVQDVRYSYDQTGNVLSIINEPASGPRDAQCFSYDYLGRMTQAWTSAAAGTTSTQACAGGPEATGIGGIAPYRHSYEYDATGNRTTKIVHGTHGGVDRTHTSTYPDAGDVGPHAVSRVTGPETVADYLYDAAGNTASIDRDGSLQTFAWDIYGKLDHVSEGDSLITYRYDADGNRMARHDDDGSTVYLPGMELRVDAAGQVSCTRYVPLPGGVELVATPVTQEYQAADHHGTASVAIDPISGQTDYRYSEPFGGHRGDVTPDFLGDKGFVGGTVDPTGLTHLGAREYDPGTGRFVSVDPIIDFSDPQQMNGYAYANNAPATLSDPTGLIANGEGPSGITLKPKTKAGGCDFFWRPACQSELPIGEQTFQEDGQGWRAIHVPVTVEEMAWEYFSQSFDALTIDQQQRVIFVTWCDNNPVSCGDMAWEPSVADEVVAEIFGINDAVDCSNGSTSGCLWLGSNFIPLGGLLAKAGKWVGKALGKIFGKSDDAVDAATAAAKACNSFVSGTLVLMADGSYKPIEDIEVGDEVIATDPATGETGPQEVTATTDSNGGPTVKLRDLVTISIDEDGDGTPDGDITATAGHAFWAATSVDGQNEQWQPARDIEGTAYWIWDNGSYVWTQVVTTQEHNREVATWNLTVDEFHTYYVVSSENAFLVHNEQCGPIYENPGHHDPRGGPNPYNPKKGLLPADAAAQFSNSILVDGVRWTKIGTGKKAVYYRYFDTGNDTWHWSGSTSAVNNRGADVSIPINQVPIEVRRS